MKYLVLHVALSLLIIVSQTCSSIAEEASDVLTSLQTMMSQTRNNGHSNWISDEQLKQADPHQAIVLLTPYQNDTEWAVKHKAFLYEVRIAQLHPTPAIRKEVTSRLVIDLLDPNSRLAKNQPYKWLLSFTEKDFSDTSKVSLYQNLITGKPSFEIVRICGVANIKEALPQLKELLLDEVAYQIEADKIGGRKWYHSLCWHARLARARMGIQEDIEKYIELVEKESGVNSRHFALLNDIGYIRQPAAINYLCQYLNSDKRLPPTTKGEPGELYAKYVMSILAESLNNYPVKRKEARNYSSEEINLCRKWMSEQTNWEIIR